MAEIMTVQEAAAQWNITERRVNELCRTKRILDAQKVEGRWQIPADTKKPQDRRKKKTAPACKHSARKLPLPIGISDYRKASAEYYYVDKTLMIRDFIDESVRVR